MSRTVQPLVKAFYSAQQAQLRRDGIQRHACDAHQLMHLMQVATGILLHAAGIAATRAVQAVRAFLLWCRVRFQRLVLALRLIQVLPEIIVLVLVIAAAAAVLAFLLVSVLMDSAISWEAWREVMVIKSVLAALYTW